MRRLGRIPAAVGGEGCGVRRGLLVTAAGALALGWLTPLAGASEGTSSESAPVVVVLQAQTSRGAVRTGAQLTERFDLSVTARYSHVFHGFAASVPTSQLPALRNDAAVDAVYRDRTVRVDDRSLPSFRSGKRQRVPAGIRRIGADDFLHLNVGRVTVDGDIAVLDTGVYQHRDLDVVRTIDCAREKGCTRKGPADDGWGHGTMVAGAAAAKDNHRGVVGVAPGARIWDIKVFNDFGLAKYSWFISALDWITPRADRIEVANLSLSGPGPHPGVARAIAAATEAGIVVVAAAGNDSSPASDVTPANAPDAITVSGFVDTDGEPGGHGPQCADESDPSTRYADDSYYTLSNFGDEVALAAPSECSLTTAAGGGYTRAGGTSMAAPHAAGAALLWVKVHELPPSPTRSALVRKGLTTRWAVSQDSPCGFSGGRSDEPALRLTACPSVD